MAIIHPKKVEQLWFGPAPMSIGYMKFMYVYVPSPS